jgi:hypothetical protein
MKRISALVILLLCALLLTGCPAGLPTPAALQLSGATYQSTDDAQLAIAVDASGAQHIARIECDTTTGKACRVIYEARRNGVTLAYQPYSPSTNYLFRNPDIAVTNSGTAYMTWQNCPDNDPNTRLCSTWYISSDSLSTLHVLEIGTHSLSAPVVVARGQTVYAIHEITNGATGGALRYCQVSPAVNPCHWVSGHPDSATDTLRRWHASAAVSSYGALYVAWLENAGGANSNTYYNDNYGAANSDMVHSLSLGPNVLYFPPAIAVETDDSWVHILLSIDNTPGSGSDEMDIYYCNPVNCAGGGGIRTVDLPVGKSWKIHGTPSLTAGSAWAVAAFSAENSDYTGTEIFSFYYSGGAAAPTASAIPLHTALSTGTTDCDPLVVLVSGTYLAIGWHICGFPPSRGDVYFYSTANGPDGVIHSPATTFAGRGGLDLAANGDYVAGIWNEVQADGRIATWLAYNSYVTYLPVIIK